MRESGGDQGTAKPSKLWNLGDLQGAAYVHGHLMAESGLDVLRPGFVSAADIIVPRHEAAMNYAGSSKSVRIIGRIEAGLPWNLLKRRNTCL